MFKLNSYFSDNNIVPIKNYTFGAKISFNYMFKNNFGIYTGLGLESNYTNENNQSNKVSVFRGQIGPSYKFINKPNLFMTITPNYTYETMGVNLTFNSTNSVGSFLQNKIGNSLQLNRKSHSLGLLLSVNLFKDYVVDFGYSYNLNQSAFNFVGSTNQNGLPMERNGVFMISTLVKIK